MFCRKYSDKTRAKLLANSLFLIFLIITIFVAIYGLGDSVTTYLSSDCHIVKLLTIYDKVNVAECLIGKETRYCIFNENSVKNLTLPTNKTFHCWHTAKEEEYLVNDHIDHQIYVEMSLFSVLTLLLLSMIIVIAVRIRRKIQEYAPYHEVL